MSSNPQPSTLQSVIDKATGAAQSTLGSLIGNPTDQAEGEKKKAQADLEHDVSHAGAKVGPVSVSASGVAANHPDREKGSWNQTIGSGKEMLGNLVGAEGLKQEGIQQNREGKAQEAQGQLSDLAGGLADRVKGSAGGAIAGLTGDVAEQEKRQLQHDHGKTLQRGVEAEIDKQTSK